MIALFVVCLAVLVLMSIIGVAAVAEESNSGSGAVVVGLLVIFSCILGAATAYSSALDTTAATVPACAMTKDELKDIVFERYQNGKVQAEAVSK